MKLSLRQYTVDFKVSRPIFKLEITKDSIEGNKHIPIYQYVPKPIDGDVLSELVCSNYRELFDEESKTFKINVDEIISNSMQDLKSKITQFVEVSLDMKSPRSSKLYKWVAYSMPNTESHNEVLIMIYKYLLSFCSHSTMKTYDKKHKENALALLEAIMEKYER